MGMLPTRHQRQTQRRRTTPTTTVRSHWDLLRERRSESELAHLLNTQLNALQSGQLLSEQRLHLARATKKRTETN
jgi:hypothetical protein